MPAITAVAARQFLARRLGAWVALCDIDDSLSRSLINLGINPLAYGALVDTDFQGVQSSQIPQLLDIAEYEGILAARANADDVQLRMANINCPEADAQRILTRREETKHAQVKSAYKYTLPVLEGGVVNLETNATADQVPYGGSY